MAELLLKYKTRHITVSFPPYLLDLITEHCYLTGLSKQDFIRSCVRFVLNDNGSQDIDIQQVNQNNEKTNSKTA